MGNDVEKREMIDAEFAKIFVEHYCDKSKEKYIMTRSEQKRLVIQYNELTDKQLELEYYNAVYDSLGSEAQIMEEQGWDEIDIIERRKFEKWLGGKADLLEKLCDERGIKLWEEDK